MENTNCYKLETPTRWQRTVRRLFPSRHFPIPPDAAAPWMTTRNLTVLDWPDRIRILVSGRLRCETRTTTDVPVNRCSSIAVAYVEAPTWMQP